MDFRISSALSVYPGAITPSETSGEINDKEWATGSHADEAVICTVDTARAALDLVAAGIGITFIPNECVEPHPGIRYIPLNNWHQALYMCILYDKWLEPPVWEFIEAVVKGFRSRRRS